MTDHIGIIRAIPRKQENLLDTNHKKEDIELLFNDICKHKKEFVENSSDFDWSKCTDCVLNKVVHYVPHGYTANEVIKRDVCFAVWHDRLIEVTYYGRNS